MAGIIYDKAVWELMHEFVSSHPDPQGGITRDQAREWFRKHYPKIKPATVGLHFEAMSVNVPGRKHHARSSSPDFHLLYRLDNSNTFVPYDSEIHGPPLNPDDSDDPITGIEADIAANDHDAGTFALEHHLRDYLSKNIHLLGEKIRLYEDDGRNGVEYPVDKGFIDILALDEDNNLVVVELKVSRGYDRTVGQILYYLNWIRQNLAEANQKARGIIIANRISNKLQVACNGFDDIEPLEYRLSVSLHPIIQ